MRQRARQRLDTDRDPEPGIAISSFARDYPAGSLVKDHAHASDQVIFATRGVMEVAARQSYWLIPPQFAVWVPAKTVHRIRMASAVSMRTLYLRPGLASGLPMTCTVLHVTPLLRELIVEAVRRETLALAAPLDAALETLIVAQVLHAPTLPMVVTLPEDPRALAVAHALLAAPEASTRMGDLCRRHGVTLRTVERVFQRELGVSFEVWRRQARLMKGIELLMQGHSVTTVAYALGYQQPNAFIALFRDTLGTTPRAWASAFKA